MTQNEISNLPYLLNAAARRKMHIFLNASPVDAELDDRTPHYSVEFKSPGMEYEYEIDAVSGSVLHVEKDRD